MKRILIKALPAAALYCCAVAAFAADELSVYAFKDGNAASGLTARLDTGEEKVLADDGSALFDLSAGAHSITILDKNGKALHNVRFDTARGQYADVSILLAFGEDPVTNINTYFPTESPAERAQAPRGTLIGTITTGGAPLDGATLSIPELGFSTTTDDEGNYRIDVPRGVYDVKITDDILGERIIEDVRVVANIDRGASFSIAPAVADMLDMTISRSSIEEVVAVAKFREESLGESERFASGVVDTLGIGELTRFGGSDVSQSVIRVPAVTVKDGRFVFIRGLGDRYVTTTLNRAQLPSTDPEKRTVPLDLFPTNFVNQLDVKKSFIASMPGESTGGTLVINTRTYPPEPEGRISGQLSFVSGLTGSDVLSDPIRGDYDWLGIDDGSRSKASTSRAISDALDYSQFYPPVVARELSRVGAILLKDDLDPGETKAKPNGVFGASYGNVFDLDWRDAELGFFVAGNYRNQWVQRVDGLQRTYSGNSGGAQNIEIEDDFRFEEYANEIDASGLLNLGLTIGNSSFGANTLLSRVTESVVRQDDGFDGDALEPSFRNTLSWVERQFISQQINGNHILGESESWIADWQFTASQATRNAPDRREVRFDLTGQDGIYNLEVPDLIRRYDELVDNNFDLSGDLEYLFDTDGDIESTLSVGGQFIYRERDSDSETYGFLGNQSLDDNAPNRLVSDVINLQTITGDPTSGFGFDDKTLASDSYEADLELNALYVSYDTIIDATYQIVAGMRYEDYRQETNTFSLAGADVSDTTEPVTSLLDESVLLPTVAVNWFLTDSQTLRFGLSKTVSRPDFKETSNATFFDPEFNIRVRGNPNLETSDAINADARYQFYWDDVDFWSVAVFYKDLKDPIERVVQAASGTVGNTRTFINADSATVYGIELEGRKEWSVGDSADQSFFVSGNISLIESEVDLESRDSRSLQGQPEYIANLILGYDDIARNQELTVLFNQLGDTIVDVGVSGQPNIILEPRLDITLNYRWFFADNWQLTFKGENLTDAEVEFTQGGNSYLEYKTGRVWTVGLNWDF